MMIGLDTNVLVRFIMQDDDIHSPKANTLIEGLEPDNPGFITLVSIIELNWVLSACYDLKREQVALAIEGIMRCKVFIVERADQVLRALRVFNKGKADFADCLIERIASSAGCSQTMTFDTGAAKYVGMTLIK